MGIAIDLGNPPQSGGGTSIVRLDPIIRTDPVANATTAYQVYVSESRNFNAVRHQFTVSIQGQCSSTIRDFKARLIIGGTKVWDMQVELKDSGTDQTPPFTYVAFHTPAAGAHDVVLEFRPSEAATSTTLLNATIGIQEW